MATEKPERCLADAKARHAAQMEQLERAVIEAGDLEPAEHVVVTKAVEGRVAGVPLHVEFIYDPGDPYAVVMVARARNGGVPWTFSRDLLDEGVATRHDGETAGEGDVRVTRVSSENALIALDSPTGHAEIEVPAGDVLDFLEQAYAQVKRGTEQQRVDWFAEYSFLNL